MDYLAEVKRVHTEVVAPYLRKQPVGVSQEDLTAFEEYIGFEMPEAGQGVSDGIIASWTSTFSTSTRIT